MSTRTQGFIDKISDAEKVDTVKWMFSAPLQNLADSVVDSKIKTNAEWQAKAGIPARIVRRSVGKCCEWCQALVGTYTYPDVPDDVYRRHDNCNCLVEYFPGDGKKQNVHTKAWEQETAEDLEARKETAKKVIPTKAEKERMEKIGTGEIKTITTADVATPGNPSFTFIGDVAPGDIYDQAAQAVGGLVEELGGTATMERGIIPGDFKWNGKAWRYIDANADLEGAITNYTEGVAGLVIDITKNPITGGTKRLATVKRTVTDAIKKSKVKSTDVIFMKDGEIVDIIRYVI